MEDAQNLAVDLRSLRKTYGEKVAVRDLSLQVPHGAVYGIIGPNGSGKTTTLRLLLRIIEPDSGESRIMGKESHPTANDSVGYLPEERGLYRKMPVLRQLVLFGQLKGLSAKEAKKKAEFWLERFDLSDWKEKKIEALSKGMSQKVQFISTVISEPKLVILDEPFSGLDPVNMETIRDVILEMKKAGTTFIFSTHDMSVAEQMCDRICMIYRGDKVLDGSLTEIQAEYGKDLIRLGYEGKDSWSPSDVEGVQIVRETQSFLELRGVSDPKSLIREAVSHGDVSHFEVVHPTLHDIFVRIARPTEEDMNEAEEGESHA